MGRGKKDSTSVYIIERIDELLGMEIPSAGFDFNADGNSTTGQIPLIRGFNATTSIASTSRLERRKKRAGLMEKSLGLEEGQSLGLKGREAASRGLLGGATEESEKEGLGIGGKKKGGKGKGRKSHLGERAEMSYEELVQEEREVEVDMGNLGVRRVCHPRGLRRGKLILVRRPSSILRLGMSRARLLRSIRFEMISDDAYWVYARKN